ncbi:hypothetical protein DD237_003164 [Peronospora effusa]|uniref:Uncharacterized protein n=1 Tax=Peronospora effusa TaxID=542832 RepID=A0A425CBV4_9STRA|nr:hypothetical protein DD237_003164 [Peronospora effusa]
MKKSRDSLNVGRSSMSVKAKPASSKRKDDDTEDGEDPLLFMIGQISASSNATGTFGPCGYFLSASRNRSCSSLDQTPIARWVFVAALNLVDVAKVEEESITKGAVVSSERLTEARLLAVAAMRTIEE